MSHWSTLAHNLSLHIKVTNHFFQQLSTIPTLLPPVSLLFTVDPASLYSNIHHAHYLASLEYYISQHASESKPGTSSLITLTNFILTDNYFSLEVYNQIEDITLGTHMAPSYVCLFMGHVAYLHSFLKPQTSGLIQIQW